MKRRPVLVLLLCFLLVGCARADWDSGDRVLVSKFGYDAPLVGTPPRRFDVVVFKYPEGPVDEKGPKNYIKRLLGLPGEIFAIFFGQAFRMPAPPEGSPPYYADLSGLSEEQREIVSKRLWLRRSHNEAHTRNVPLTEAEEQILGNVKLRDDYTYTNDERSKTWFQQGKFEIIRKPPAVALAMRRIVYDNDFQAKDLGPEYRRWAPRQESAWATDDYKVFRAPGAPAQQIDWLRYQHLLRPSVNPTGKPQLITDFMGYNSANSVGGPQSGNWVGDLMVELELKVDKAEGEFWLELSRGVDRFQARWKLDTGVCTLFRVDQDGKAKELDSRPTSIKAPGNYQIRLANFDARLTVWVDGDLPFGEGVDYPPAEIPLAADLAGLTPEQVAERWAELREQRGPTRNDLEPASIGSRGAALQVQHLRLWRDTYYTLDASHGLDAGHITDWSDPKAWSPLRNLGFTTMYVQPGHYLCLGDNSTASSDSRTWGLVPERLLLGRALLVYYPFGRAGPIR